MESTPADPSRPLIEAAVAVVIDGQAVLIARRPAHVPLGGLWEFPGGKLEPGETPEAAAVREVQEELALAVVPTGRLTPITHTYAHARVRLTPILCRPTGPGDATAIGCDAFRWIPPADLPQYPFPAANGPLLAEVMALPLQSPPTRDSLGVPTTGD